MQASDPPDAVLSTVYRFLRSFTRQGPLLIAISGGSDSTALLVAFDMALRSPDFSGFSLFAATVDHGLREGSDTEAQAVARLAKRRGVSHRILSWTGDKPSSGLQSAARAARYRLLAQEARRVGAVAILVGHTAGDQRETIAMRRTRGAGEGMAGMAPAVLLQGETWVLRPFLDLDREVLRDFLRSQGESWLEDPSNINPRFERARLRLTQGDGILPQPAALTGVQRCEGARQQARWLERHVRVSHCLVAAVDPDIPRGAVEALALFKLAGALGGVTHLSPLESRDSLFRWLKTAQLGRKTLGGTVFDLRRQGLFLYREARNLGPVAVAGAEKVWDGRFVVGRGTAPGGYVQGAEGEHLVAALMADGIPEPVAKRVIRAAPHLSDGADASLFAARYRIAAHQDFLSGYELPVATALRHHFALAELPAPPVPPDAWNDLWPSITRNTGP